MESKLDILPLTNKHLFKFSEVGNGNVEVFAAIGIGLRADVFTNHFHRIDYLTEGIILTWVGDPFNIRKIGKAYWKYK